MSVTIHTSGDAWPMVFYLKQELRGMLCRTCFCLHIRNSMKASVRHIFWQSPLGSSLDIVCFILLLFFVTAGQPFRMVNLCKKVT